MKPTQTRKGVYIMNGEYDIDFRALFCDGTRDYVIPEEPNPYSTVKLRFRTARDNIDYVYLVTDRDRFLMKKYKQLDRFDYFETEVMLDNDIFYYYFEIHKGNRTCFYNKMGASDGFKDWYKFFIIPGFKTPKWAKGAVMYQIYTDRFYNGDKENDVETNEYRYIGEGTVKVDNWEKYPDRMDVREFYGGDLQGVIDKLDYLSDLGIDAIYFNPLFVSPSNHKYDIQDYDYIDPHFGKIIVEEENGPQSFQMENRNALKYIRRVTDKRNLEASNKLFIELVEKAHERGIRVILDGVFNHCGSFNKWMDRERIYEEQDGYEKGAYVSAESPYRNFFRFFNESKWPYNDTYDGWWGHDTLPKLNYEESKELYDYIMKVAKKWVSPPFNADGWRLDVAADLGHSNEFNHKFWKDFRKAVKESNPNAIVLAEHYGDAGEWLRGDEWDTVMNYDAFLEPITWFLTGMEKHSDDYRGDLLGNARDFILSIVHHSSSFSTPTMQISMNELSNHDHSRFLTRTNKKVGRISTLGAQAANENVNKGVFKEAVVFQMTWPGAPTVYYGDEAGVCGFTDPDNRRTYPWGNEDQDLISFHKEIIRIHKANEELLSGSVKFLKDEYNVISYGRFNEKEQTVVVINNNYHDLEFDIPVWETGIPDNTTMENLLCTYESGFSIQPLVYNVINGYLKIKVARISAVILKHKSTEVSQNNSISDEKEESTEEEESVPL